MEQKKIIKTERRDSCGCHTVEFADDTGQVNPCPLHALMRAGHAAGQAARALMEMAQMLQHAGAAMLSHNQAAALSDIARNVGGPKT